jgi:hypothetical protein
MNTQVVLVDKIYHLEKFPGKGGWTFARIPEILQDKNSPFGWVCVSGSIDGFEIKKYHLMPMGDGHLFLPVKAEIRKKIGKKEGDMVHVILFKDDTPLEIPEEFLLCLEDEPNANAFFQKLSDSEKRYYIDWIYSSKKEETKIDRISKSLDRLRRRLKYYDTGR